MPSSNTITNNSFLPFLLECVSLSKLLREEEKGHSITYLGYQANMHHSKVVSANSKLKLPKGLNKRHAFNVTDCSTQLKYTKKGKRVKQVLLQHAEHLNKKVHIVWRSCR